MTRGLSCLYTANARNLPTLDGPEALSFRQTLCPVLTCFHPLSCKTIYSSEHKLSSISKKRTLRISRHSSMIFSASFHTSVYFQLLQSFPLQIWPASPPVCCCRCSCEPPSLDRHKRTWWHKRCVTCKTVSTACGPYALPCQRVRQFCLLILFSGRVPATARKPSIAVHPTGNDG